MILKEAKEEIWNKWRHSKGRRKDNPNMTTKSQNQNLEEKLTRIELEEEKYKKESEKTKQREKEKKKRLEKHWDMLRWIVNFMEENDQKWKKMEKVRKLEQEQREEKERWEQLTREDKIKELEWEEFAVKQEKLTNKEERLR